MPFNNTYDSTFDKSFKGTQWDGFISLDQMVARASASIKNPEERDFIIFRQWIWEAEKKIGLQRHFNPPVRVEYEDGALRKPDRMVHLHNLQLFTEDDAPIKFRYRNWSKGTAAAIENSRSPIIVTEDENFFYISSEDESFTSPDCVSYAMVTFIGLPVNNNDELMIPDTHETAITQYVIFRYHQREGKNAGLIQSSYQLWQRELSIVKSKQKMPNLLEAKEIMKVWNTLINKPVYDTFSDPSAIRQRIRSVAEAGGNQGVQAVGDVEDFENYLNENLLDIE